MNRVECKLEAVGNAQLVENVVEMILDRLLGNEKFLADFFIAETLSDQLNDFFFAVAEQRLLAARTGFGRFRKRLHDFGGHAIIEPDFAGMHAMNALDQEIRGGLLEDNAACAKTHGADYVAIVFSRREHHDARGQRVKIHFFENGQSVFIGHAQIEEKNVGLQLGEELDALRAILSFADDGDVLVGLEEFAQAITKDGVVIG